MEDKSTLLAQIDALKTENANLRQKQIEINQAKELYLKIFEDFPALIWRSGLDKNCNYFNKTWLEFTGRTLEQEVGNGWTEGVHPEDFDFCLKTYVNAFDNRESFMMEYRIKNKAGEYRWISDFGRPFYDLDCTFLGYIGSCYDITETKDNLIKLEELNTTKNMFFSILAHDLRSPFTTLIGLSSLLMEDMEKRDSIDKDFVLKNMNIVSKNSLAYLDDLLLWGNMISDGVVLQKQAFSCNDVCKELLKDLEEQAHLKNITLEFIEECQIELNADIHMFKTIVRNLLNNAFKFTNQFGKIQLILKKVDNVVEIAVIDNGVGINQKAQDILWDFTNHTTTIGTEHEVGTGFGLSICKHLVDKHQGKIWVSSKKDQGSEFRVQLPL